MAIISNNEAGRGFTDIIRLTYEDLQSIGNGGQQTIATIPAGGAVELCGVHEATAFAGTTSLVIDIGTTTGDPDEFIDALDVDAMTVPVYNTGDTFTGAQSQPVKAVASDTSIVIEVTDAAIASATAGEIVIGLRILDLGQFAVS
tara:strand:- start:1023 stop:1457 length:435 start_codon:yes stop_codon:yes gene_type:complete